MKTRMTDDQKRALLDSFKGKIWSAEWVKKSGEVRKATCKHMIHSAFAGGHASTAQKSTVAHKTQYYTACDLNKGEKWINIDLHSLKHVKCGEIEVDFEDD